MPWLLDTNAVIAVMNDPRGVVASRVRRKAPDEVFISTIVMHELYYGAFKSTKQAANIAVVESLAFTVLTLDSEDARAGGAVRAQLKMAGTPIGPYDVLIAGQALCRGLTLVTHNLSEFARVPALAVEDWSVASVGATTRQVRTRK